MRLVLAFMEHTVRGPSAMTTFIESLSDHFEVEVLTCEASHHEGLIKWDDHMVKDLEEQLKGNDYSDAIFIAGTPELIYGSYSGNFAGGVYYLHDWYFYYDNKSDPMFSSDYIASAHNVARFLNKNYFPAVHHEQNIGRVLDRYIREACISLPPMLPDLLYSPARVEEDRFDYVWFGWLSDDHIKGEDKLDMYHFAFGERLAIVTGSKEDGDWLAAQYPNATFFNGIGLQEKIDLLDVSLNALFTSEIEVCSYSVLEASARGITVVFDTEDNWIDQYENGINLHHSKIDSINNANKWKKTLQCFI